MKVLVTGASGFIGKALTAHLVPAHAVYVLSRKFPPGVWFKGVKEFFEKDITRPFQLKQEFDCVIHLAALNVTHVGRADDDEYRRVNVTGTEHLLRAVRARNFIFFSTAKVYRPVDGEITEQSPIAPQSDYAKSKWEAEELCRRLWPPERLTILRSVNIAGPGQPEKAVLPVFFKKAASNEPLEIIGSGRTAVQLLHIKDLLDALGMIVQKGMGLGVLNLCSNEVITLKELAESIVRMSASSSQILIANQDPVITGRVTARRALELLGWRARYTIKDVLKDYLVSI